MSNYKHIFFDLDHTLWDFEKCSSEALAEIYESFDLQSLSENISFDSFLNTYHQINYRLWHLYDMGQIDQNELRYSRFKLVLGEFNIADSLIPNEKLADAYLQITPTKPYLVPYAQEVLEYLQGRYCLHIITNGFAEIQDIKMNSSKIAHFFDLIVTSSNAGCKKPSKEIFEYAISEAKAQKVECLMIGDNLTTDIQGAKNAEIDYIFFNPTRQPYQEEIMQEIFCLSELKALL